MKQNYLITALWIVVVLLVAILVLFELHSFLSPLKKVGSVQGINPPTQLATSTGAETSTTTSRTPSSQESQTPPVLNSISPTSGLVGTQITLTGSGFTAQNTILFNQNVAAHMVVPVTEHGGVQTLTFTVPSSIGPDCKAGQACPQYLLLITPRAYFVSVENENGKSASTTFTVTAQ